MQAKYLLLFRCVLIETLLLQGLFAPQAERTGAGLWIALALYAVAAAAHYLAARKGAVSEALSQWSFLGDIVVTSAVLYETGGMKGDFYVAYFLVILSSCFIENLRFSFIIGGVASLVYGALAFPGLDQGLSQAYLLRLSLLLISAFFSSYVVEHARQRERATAERYETRLAWMNRLSVVGQALSNVLHELKTPLGTIGLTVDHLRRMGTRASTKRMAASLKAIQREIEKASAIISDRLDYAKPGPLALAPMSLRRAVRRAADAARLRLRDKEVTLELRLSAEGRVLGSERHLVQVVTNLLMNAIQAMPLGGRLTVELIEEAGRARVTVTDTGHGIERERLSALFEPFAAAGDGSGHGLGLSIARWITLRHGGDIEIHSEGPRQGTRVSFHVPLAP